MSAAVWTGATRARHEVFDRLERDGIAATLDAGAFYPQPLGVLIGRPALIGRGLASSTFEVPVTIVSGDPLTTTEAIDRLYALADEVADSLNESAYRPGSWQGGPNAEPLPCVELVATVTLSYPTLAITYTGGAA